MGHQYLVLQPAFVLHSRPFRDSSAIVEFFTRDAGRVAAVARGVRGRKKGAPKGAVLQPFTPLLMSCSGNGELKTLTGAEAVENDFSLAGDVLFCGMYINELLMRLLIVMDPHPLVYQRYTELMTRLSELDRTTPASMLEPQLRLFEFDLLEQLGFAVPLKYDADTGESVSEQCGYAYRPDSGLHRLGFIDDSGFINSSGSTSSSVVKQQWFAGSDLLAIAQGDYTSLSTRKAAKKIIRLALEPHLNGKPLNSRRLFLKHK